MRVHHLVIENITSLKGHHKINFDEILHGEDLFAITGPTGSGKSSILAAISLALYNSNYKEGLSSIELITQGEAYGKVELEFSTGNTNYKSVWECRLKQKNGTLLKNPKLIHNFYQNGEIIERTGEEILGLSFDQFSKTIVLNQGQFARFLTSKYKDRRDILEKLYDSKTLTLLGSKLNDKIKESKSELQAIELALENVLPLTEEEIKSLEGDKEKLGQKRMHSISLQDAYRQIEKEIQDYFNCINNIITNIEKKAKYERLIAEHIEKNNAVKKETDQALKERTAIQDKEIKLRPILIKCIEKINEQNALIREQGQNNQQAKELESSFLKKKELLDNATKDKEETTRGLATLNKRHPSLFVSDAVFDSYVSTVKKIDSLSDEQKTRRNTIINLNEQISANQGQLESLKEAIKEKEELLKASGVDYSTQPIDEWRAVQNAKINEQKKHLEQFEEFERELKKKAEDNIALENELQDEKKKLQAIEKELRANDTAIELISKEIEVLKGKQKIYELEMAIEKIKKESEADGKCLVCGNDYIEAVESSKDAIPIDIKKLHSKEEEHQRLLQLRSTLKAKEENKLEAINSLSSKVNEHQEKIEELKKKTENNSGYINSKSKLESLINESIMLPEKLKQLKKEQEDFKQIILKKQSLESSIKQLEEADTKDVQDQYQLISEIKINFPHYPDSPEMIALLFEEDTKVFHRIKRGIEKETFIKNNIKGIQEDLKEITRKSEQTKKNDELLSEKIEDLKKEIQDKYNYVNPQELLNQLSNELEQANSKHSKLREEQVSLERSIDSNNQFISGITESLKAYQLEKSNIEANIFKIDIPTNVTEVDITITTSLLSKLKISSKTTEISDETFSLIKTYRAFELPKEVASIKEHVMLITKEFHELESTLRHYKEAESKSNKLRAEYADQKSKLDRLQMLNDLIGKQEFRDFALSIIERELVHGANNELKKICDGRYILKQIPSSKHKFEFYVADNFSGGMERKVSTLSGGETFLVSLAMAMALSEMTRGQCEIDSFFIDEGFGSLDQDAIDDALDTLMQIRNRGKRIGIISHVQKLTERISVNINLVKTDLGESSIEILT